MTTSTLANRTVGELATEMPVSITVFEKWRIDYCCGGMRPIAEACADVGKTLDEFSAALRAAAAPPASVDRQWDGETLATIARDIVGTYHVYTRDELQTLSSLAQKVLEVHGLRHSELQQVVYLVEALAADMRPHMLKEEQVLFPYVEELEEALEKGETPPTPFFGTVRHPIRMMMLEHDRVGELLAAVRSVTGGFTPPEDGCFSYRELYRRLAEFERITHEHVHVENNVYFPRAVSLEERAGNAADFGSPHEHSMCGS